MLRIQGSKYAVCKHGPSHECMCGFAHKLADVGMPHNYIERMRICKAHYRGGHPGIDLYLGQLYAPMQYDRIISMIFAEQFDRIPNCFRQFTWFEGLGSANENVLDCDFGFYALLESLPQKVFKAPWSRILQLEVERGTCMYPFALAVDKNGYTFGRRMEIRMASGLLSRLLRCVCALTDVDSKFARGTSTHWGIRSQVYLSLVKGRTYYFIGESGGNFPWYYVAEDPKRILTSANLKCSF